MKGTILVLDDEELMRDYLDKHLSKHGYDVQTFESPKDALKALGEDEYDLVISDVKMPEMTGDEVLTHVKEHHEEVGVILITGFGSINHAVRTVQKGAYDYITKPFSGAEILARVNGFFKFRDEKGSTTHGADVVAGPKSAEPDQNGKHKKAAAAATRGGRYEVKLVGEDSKIQQLVDALPQIAQNNAPVLIQGESGTGKEVFASLIHYNSPRADKPYVKINCANLPRDLVESTLFGHVKGAFTGAISDKKGAFEEADTGTLLLDEITEIDIAIQAKLLRVLQEREFSRVGSQKTQTVDVRVIATSNRNIGQAIKDGEFREDLYYRLNVFPISIPPLRERKDDIPLLAEYFVDKYTAENGMSEKEISKDLMDYLMRQDWKGNVRELSNLIQRGVLMSADDEVITIEHVKNLLFTNIDEEIRKELISELPLLTIEEMELKMIQLALNKTNGNQKEASKLLGVSDRTIRNKLKKMEQRSESE
ncbi:MAG: sigma-54-dependent transcriptional regulator [Bacteroidota bacterium]